MKKHEAKTLSIPEKNKKNKTKYSILQCEYSIVIIKNSTNNIWPIYLP